MKTCTKCGEAKEFSEFCKNKRKHDGYHITCKKCIKERKQILKKSPLMQLEKAVRSSTIIENRMLFKEEKRLCSTCGNIFSIKGCDIFYCSKCRNRYYKKNKEKAKKQHKEYVEKNKEEIARYKKEYYENNKEKAKKQQKEYYERTKNIRNNTDSN